MTPQGISEWDDALLDLVNMGLIEIVRTEDGTIGFRFNENLFNF